MDFKQSFFLAIKSLMSSKARALLTMLGIIIGVGAVIVIISLGDGMEAMMTESFESMGTNLIMVQVRGRNTSRQVTDDQMMGLVDKYPEYIAAVSPSVNVSARVKVGNETLAATGVTGVSEQDNIIQNLKIAEGRFLQYADIMTIGKVCVIGSYINDEYFQGSGLGQVIRIGGDKYTVVGVLEEKAGYGEGSDDDSVYIPYTSAQKLNKNSRITSYNVSALSSDTTDMAKWAVEDLLFRVFQDKDAYFIFNMAEMLGIMSTLQGTMMTVLVAIAAISLLVGGIGIMNIMLVSVTERTREIGIRKSLGAKRKDIRSQFIIEAGTTSAIGGVIGIAVGVGLAGFAGGLLGITAVPSTTAITVAFSVSVAIGVIFGYLPANKAAKLNPIDALRYD